MHFAFNRRSIITDTNMVYYIIRKGRPEDCCALYRLIKETAEFNSQKKHPGSDDRDFNVETTEESEKKNYFTNFNDTFRHDTSDYCADWHVALHVH